MSDDIELASGEYVPIQETVCECRHGYDEHPYSRACGMIGCACAGFIAAWVDVASS